MKSSLESGGNRRRSRGGGQEKKRTAVEGELRKAAAAPMKTAKSSEDKKSKKKEPVFRRNIRATLAVDKPDPVEESYGEAAKDEKKNCEGRSGCRQEGGRNIV